MMVFLVTIFYIGTALAADSVSNGVLPSAPPLEADKFAQYLRESGLPALLANSNYEFNSMQSDFGVGRYPVALVQQGLCYALHHDLHMANLRRIAVVYRALLEKDLFEHPRDIESCRMLLRNNAFANLEVLLSNQSAIYESFIQLPSEGQNIVGTMFKAVMEESAWQSPMQTLAVINSFQRNLAQVLEDVPVFQQKEHHLFRAWLASFGGHKRIKACLKNRLKLEVVGIESLDEATVTSLNYLRNAYLILFFAACRQGYLIEKILTKGLFPSAPHIFNGNSYDPSRAINFDMQIYCDLSNRWLPALVYDPALTLIASLRSHDDHPIVEQLMQEQYSFWNQQKRNRYDHQMRFSRSGFDDRLSIVMPYLIETAANRNIFGLTSGSYQRLQILRDAICVRGLDPELYYRFPKPFFKHSKQLAYVPIAGVAGEALHKLHQDNQALQQAINADAHNRLSDVADIREAAIKRFQKNRDALDKNKELLASLTLLAAEHTNILARCGQYLPNTAQDYGHSSTCNCPTIKCPTIRCPKIRCPKINCNCSCHCCESSSSSPSDCGCCCLLAMLCCFICCCDR